MIVTDEVPAEANADQSRYWNIGAGQKWVLHQGRMDRLLSGVRDALLLRAAPRPGERVLDVGCGSGDVTRAAADAVCPGGAVIGADISEPLLALARRQAAGRPEISCVLADVQTHGFPPASVDLVISRFGVMFFSDPAAAFSNLARTLRPGGRIVFASWAERADNPWFHLPGAAAAARLGALEPDPPGSPGPFAFADGRPVLNILSASGFSDPAVETVDMTLPVDGAPEDAAKLAAEIGPVARIMADRNGNAEDLRAIIAAAASALGPYVSGDLVRVPARIHFHSAVRP